jgi:hypothetical protein
MGLRARVGNGTEAMGRQFVMPGLDAGLCIWMLNICCLNSANLHDFMCYDDLAAAT